mgnify:FL=1
MNIEQDKDLTYYFNLIKDIKVLSYEEQQYLFKNINSKNRKKLIECNLKLVVFVAKRFFNRSYESLTPMDLIEAGNIGLIEAIEKFDYKKGYRFSTYASHYIKKEIIKEIYNADRMIRRPYYYEEKLTKNKENVDNILSLEEDITNLLTEDSKPLMYFIKDDSCDIYEDISYFELKEIINDILNTLTPRQKQVLLLRYGFDNNEFKNLEEVGKLIGISREGTRKALVKAFKKIRDNKDLKDYLNY